MKNKFIILIISILSLFCLSGCDQTSGFLSGGAIGSLAGAGVGSALGGHRGAVFGAVVGGLGGAAIGSDIGAQEECRNCPPRPVREVRTKVVEVHRPVVEKRVYVRDYGPRPYREEVYCNYEPRVEYRETSYY